MSKQTINIGASPNDGTGTPLRTSFDYTNQNFTELYTALGGGVGLPGATTQVIFNDGGTNLAGDAGLVYNKTTDALTVAGLVTAGSATITGDLTVDTTTLVVDATNDRVGIGTATPGRPLEVYNTTESTVWAKTTTGISLFRSGGTSGDFYFGIDNSTGAGFGQGNYSRLIYSTGAYPIVFSTNATERYRIDSTGISTWSVAGSTAMTLNSTGLGIGASPATKLDVRGANNASQATFSGTASRGLLISTRSDGLADDRTVILNAQHSTGSLGQLVIQTVGTDRLLVDSSGNIGIGVAPSVILDVLSAAAEGTIRLTSTIDGSNASPKASSLSLRSGSSSVETARIASFNRFSNVGGGDLVFSTADTSAVLQTRATIDSSGNLILQSSATPATLATNGMLTVNATSNTNLRFSYRGSDGTTRVANLTLA